MRLLPTAWLLIAMVLPGAIASAAAAPFDRDARLLAALWSGDDDASESAIAEVRNLPRADVLGLLAKAVAHERKEGEPAHWMVTHRLLAAGIGGERFDLDATLADIGDIERPVAERRVILDWLKEMELGNTDWRGRDTVVRAMDRLADDPDQPMPMRIAGAKMAASVTVWLVNERMVRLRDAMNESDFVEPRAILDAMRKRADAALSRVRDRKTAPPIVEVLMMRERYDLLIKTGATSRGAVEEAIETALRRNDIDDPMRTLARKKLDQLTREGDKRSKPTD